MLAGQGFDDGNRVVADRAEQCPGGPRGLPTALFPVSQRPEFDAEQFGELALRQTSDVANRADVDVDWRHRRCGERQSQQSSDSLATLPAQLPRGPEKSRERFVVERHEGTKWPLVAPHHTLRHRYVNDVPAVRRCASTAWATAAPRP